MAMNPFDNFDAAYIAALNNSYRDAKIRPSGRAMLPEGKYQTIIDSVSLKPSQYYADELQFAIGFEVLTGDQRGVKVSKYISVVPERIETLKNDLIILGVDLADDITNLGKPEVVQSMLDQIVDITVKHRRKDNGQGFYMNIYLNRSHGKSDNNFVESDDDDNPFDV